MPRPKKKPEAGAQGASFYEIAEQALALERRGKDIVRLNVGDTNLPVPQRAKDAAAKSMRDGRGGYGSSRGSEELLSLIAAREKCGIENVVVGPGSKHLLFALLSVLCKKGDSVAFPSPHWPAYSLACAQLGLRAKTKDTLLGNAWQFETLPKAKLAIICNPLNPASTIHGHESVSRAISDAGKAGSRLIIDEAYRGIAFEPIPAYDCIRLRSFSKEFNMENWRLGYAVAPEETAEKLVKFNQITSTCVPQFVQQAGIACLENEKGLLSENTAIWKSRMGAAGRALKKAGFVFAQPQSGMYLFAAHERVEDGGRFALSLLGKGVAVAPGSGFGNYGRFIRICANQPEGLLERAIEKMGEAAHAVPRT
ncbi:TPA: pyridoxal phosphate-dependent aminotransferase [Candidatus Micrarchaeota archaeon]|nr:pyridoxal phosphate-dependent aminotransferase [Candidatus Micrarchaeota archaeon]HIH30444.1 pyridoxal phosphate-dependent aminotransferase [Candidatus Micrarchaeota archaeon]